MTENRTYIRSIVATALALGFVSAVTPVVAQEDPVADLMSCEPLRLPRERLACFDAILKKYKAQVGVLSPRDAQTNSGTPYYQRNYSEAPAGSRQYTPRPVAPSSGYAPPSEYARPDPSPRRSATPPPGQLPDRFRARVVRSWVGAVNDERRIKLELDNGTVWTQTDGPWVDLPEGNPPVEIYEGFMGGWRMKVDDKPGVSFVRRLPEEENARTQQSYASAGVYEARPPAGRDNTSQPERAERPSPPASRQTASADPAQLPDRFRARIVRTWVGAVDNERRIKIELDNGTVWAQTDGPWVDLPEGNPEVEIYEGVFGGHRMKVGDEPGVSWVRRIE